MSNRELYVDRQSVPFIVVPMSLLVSGFHGNADAVMMAFILLSLFLLETGGPVESQAQRSGMAMNIKIVPVIFVPAVCLFLGTLHKQAQMLRAAPVSIGRMLQESKAVRERVFGYSTHNGFWGSFLQTAKNRLQFLGAAIVVFILGSITMPLSPGSFQTISRMMISD
jgi:mannosyltransferase PIG-M